MVRAPERQDPGCCRRGTLRGELSCWRRRLRDRSAWPCHRLDMDVRGGATSGVLREVLTDYARPDSRHDPVHRGGRPSRRTVMHHPRHRGHPPFAQRSPSAEDRFPSLSNRSWGRPCRAAKGSTAAACEQRSSQKGGLRAYRGRLEKDRSRDETRHSIASFRPRSFISQRRFARAPLPHSSAAVPAGRETSVGVSVTACNITGRFPYSGGGQRRVPMTVPRVATTPAKAPRGHEKAGFMLPQAGAPARPLSEPG